MHRWNSVIGAGLLAVGVAYLSAWILVPETSVTPSGAVDPRAYFELDDLRRIEDFRSGQRLLALAGIAVELGLLVLLARSVRLRRRFSAARKPLLAGGLLAGLIALLIAVVTLPIGLVAFERARDVGLVTQGLPSWLRDRTLSAVISVLMAGVAGILVMFLIKKLKRLWWPAGGGLIMVYAVLAVWIWPVAVSPLFSDFEPLERGEARAEILSLADRADVDVGEVLVVDAGRRSRSINAYVTGLGDTKRIVVYDNALNQLQLRELRAILAHELAHVEQRDVQRGLLWVLIVAPFGALFVHRFATHTAGAKGVSIDAPAMIPHLALALSLAVLVLGVPGAWLSRGVEAKADEIAMSLTGEPEAFISLQSRIAEDNLSDPDPPAVWSLIFGSHPSTVERIGAAKQMR